MLGGTAYDWQASFDDLLRRLQRTEPIGNEDLVGTVRTLFDEVRDVHESGNVADLARLDRLAVSPDGELTLGKVPIQRPTERIDIASLDAIAHDDQGAPDSAAPGPAPRYEAGYASWERAAGHHDALTDIFQLGLLCASLATGLDFRDPAHLARFVAHRANLMRLNRRLHPVLARVIFDMTHLRRAERAADLSGLIDLIDDYPSIEVDDADAKASDLAAVADLAVRRERTQEYFRNRLFEVTRRNKLLYFADRHGVDLTRGSLPVMLDYTALHPRQLLTASPELLQRLAALNDRGEARGELELRRWLHCEDYPYLAPALDKIRSAARKDSRELGFNQLRLVLAFLRWHDDERGERIETPLVMLPVSMKKQHGTADGFTLTLEQPATEADVNPVLRYILHDRFRFELPETLDMSSLEAIRGLARRLEERIGRSRPGLRVRLAETPDPLALQAAVRRQLEEHRRRQRRATVNLKDWHGVGYSYAGDGYQPLGLELYDRFVRTSAALRSQTAEPEIADGLRSLADLTAQRADASTGDPADRSDSLVWEIDLCAVTLANFNTRKMSLVRDYETLLDGYAGPHANYTALFECEARPELRPVARPAHTARNLVLPSDPSQDDAILRAATGESYVIQGPPGTGKSQTIANLLAELAARGKSVLFVCEKRVALDVVHSRLQDAGIGDLASLVHDARDDRLRFIADLKGLYEGWLASRANRTVRDKRTALVAEIEALAAQLQAFSFAMQRSVGAGDTTLRDLLDHAIAADIPRPRLPLREREAAPPWGAFVEGEAALGAFDRLLQDVAIDRGTVLALLATLRRDLAERPDLADWFAAARPALAEATDVLDEIAAAAAPSGSDTEPGLKAMLAQAAAATDLAPLAASGRLPLLDASAPETAHLRDQFARLDALDAALHAAAADIASWQRRPTPAEAEAWLATARRNEGRFWSVLSAEWRAVQEHVRRDLGRAPPSVVAALEPVVREHHTRAARAAQAEAIREAVGRADPDAARAALDALWAAEADPDPASRALLDMARADPQAASRHIGALVAARPRLEGADAALRAVFADAGTLSAGPLRERLATLDLLGDRIAPLLHGLHRMAFEAPTLAAAWQRAPMPLESMRAASLHKEVHRSLALASEAERLAGDDVRKIAEQLHLKLAELRGLNARTTLDERKSRFRQRAGTENGDYTQGRAFLEHQFSLYRPSAALRDFLTGARGVVVRDIKPIWMMSPLSVADTLPLDERLFDVVVFDEASQIPIEDALPTLYRAPQMIVVGDEMQLPPPSYFGRKPDTDDADLPDYIAFGMQAESLLDKAAAALPATRLEWHYRSRHESLIGFCNQAFYAGHLKTIPSRHALARATAIDAGTPAPMKEQAQRVLGRPISFHRLPDGVYVGQQNLPEAAYIADLVRALLGQDASKSIGIVAFSQAQQAAIEDALERLAGEHAAFRTRLTRAMGLEHEELFVKNLENVQGDERDIIIVSVAYGPGATGRMVMNFGPINQEGGEKRLNVIFSRAKHHVAVVASFDPDAITNDWNKGARALKRYLMYAAATSVGDVEAMRAAVAGYPGSEHIGRAARAADPLADLVAETYRRQGRTVVRGLGQSTARCDVAVRAAPGGALTTAVLTDNRSHYAIADVIDRYVTYPGLLRAAGWSVEFALAKDWLDRIPRTGEAPAPVAPHKPADD
jgi:hypothetical protein